MDYNIQTISYGVLGNADKIEITVLPFSLGSDTASVSVAFKNSENMFETKSLKMPTEVYNVWGTDDSVVVEWVAEALNVTLA